MQRAADRTRDRFDSAVNHIGVLYKLGQKSDYTLFILKHLYILQSPNVEI